MTLLGKGYVSYLDGDERVTHTHGATFRFRQDDSSMKNELSKGAKY
jgi:hypothetical protein